MDKIKWQCPICDCEAYQKFGGVPLPAIKIREIDKFGPVKMGKTTIRFGTHFMCRGCSVFFSNPKLFNSESIKEKQKARLNDMWNKEMLRMRREYKEHRFRLKSTLDDSISRSFKSEDQP